jgi:membrane protease YdiL (CAAX protease family)
VTPRSKAAILVGATAWLTCVGLLFARGLSTEASFALGFAVVTLGLVAIVARRAPLAPLGVGSFVPAAVMLGLYVILCAQAFNDFSIDVLGPVQHCVQSATAPLVPLARSIHLPSSALVGAILIVIALTACRATGTPWSELGFTRGHNTGRVVAVFAAPLIIGLVVILAVGRATPAQLASLVPVALFVAAAEELFFRACLQSQLERAWGPTRALVLTALLFGVFHTGMLAASMRLPVLVAAAVGITQQGVLGGLVLGTAFQRTRTIWVSIVLHALGNVALIPLFS